MIYLFGEFFRPEIVFALLGAAAICLVLLNLHVIFFLSLVALILPNLDTPFGQDARVLRWAFLAALMAKGIIGTGLGVFPKPLTPAHRLLIALVLLILASTAYSIGPAITIAQGGMMIILLGAVFAVLWNSWSHPEVLLKVCEAFFLFAFCLFAYQALYMLMNLEHVFGAGRLSGAFLNPNGAGSAVAFLAPFVYWKFNSTRSGPGRALIAGLAVFMALNLFLSGARSALLGAVVCMGVVLTYVHGARMLLLGLTVGFPILVMFVTGDTGDRDSLDTRWRPGTVGTLSDRIPMWEKGYDLLTERPLHGYGFAMNKFAEYGRADYELLQALDTIHGANYHNAHLQLALDLGILGLALFWGVLRHVLKGGFALFRSSRRTSLELAGIVFFATFVTLLGDSLVHGWLFSPGSSMAIVFWVSAAAVLRVRMLSEEDAVAEVRDDEQALEESAGTAVPEPVQLPILR